ncbi:hypothetical protein HYV10_00235 [Candidatus Dependentiae bacterium]|nr:hypothetical protein [Candidatus Dependentiae bacterium]
MLNEPKPKNLIAAITEKLSWDISINEYNRDISINKYNLDDLMEIGKIFKDDKSYESLYPKDYLSTALFGILNSENNSYFPPEAIQYLNFNSIDAKNSYTTLDKLLSKAIKYKDTLPSTKEKILENIINAIPQQILKNCSEKELQNIQTKFFVTNIPKKLTQQIKDKVEKLQKEPDKNRKTAHSTLEEITNYTLKEITDYINSDPENLDDEKLAQLTSSAIQYIPIKTWEKYYRTAALQYHPDRNSTNTEDIKIKLEKMKILNNINDRIRDKN